MRSMQVLKRREDMVKNLFRQWLLAVTVELLDLIEITTQLSELFLPVASVSGAGTRPLRSFVSLYGICDWRYQP